MNLPILAKLKDGEKFDFQTLANNVEQTEEYWEWWWAEKAKSDEISRPEIISEDDPILLPCPPKLEGLGSYICV